MPAVPAGRESPRCPGGCPADPALLNGQIARSQISLRSRSFSTNPRREDSPSGVWRGPLDEQTLILGLRIRRVVLPTRSKGDLRSEGRMSAPPSTAARTSSRPALTWMRLIETWAGGSKRSRLAQHRGASGRRRLALDRTVGRTPKSTMPPAPFRKAHSVCMPSFNSPSSA